MCSAPEHGRERLDRGPGDVQLGLLGGQRDTGGLGMEAQLPGPLLLRAVTLPHPARPDSPGGAELRDLLEEIDMSIEEERQSGGEIVDVHPALETSVDVGHPVGEREGQLLRSC